MTRFITRILFWRKHNGLFSEESKTSRPDFPEKLSIVAEMGFRLDDENVGIKENWQTEKRLSYANIGSIHHQCKMSGIGDATYHPIIWYKEHYP